MAFAVPCTYETNGCILSAYIVRIVAACQALVVQSVRALGC